MKIIQLTKLNDLMILILFYFIIEQHMEKPLAKITAHKVKKFTWRSLICRHGLPFAIVTNNGIQFMEKGYEQFLRLLGIKHLVSFMEHP